jgi:hypothetical protein
MPDIRERSQMIKEAVSIATGIPIRRMMADYRQHDETKARRCALDLHMENLGFMGKNWACDQLGMTSRRFSDYEVRLRVEPEIKEDAQAIYEKMVKDDDR